MSINIEEDLLTLSEAAKRLPNRPHSSSIWRWYARGVRGVRLETIVVAGRRYTSVQALARFAARSTAAAEGMTATYRTPAQRRRAIDQAERELDDAGS